MNDQDQKGEVIIALEIANEELANLNVFIYQPNEIKTVAYLKSEIQKEIDHILQVNHDENASKNETFSCLKVDSKNFKILNQLNIQKMRVVYELIESMIESNDFESLNESLENTLDIIQAVKTMFIDIDTRMRSNARMNRDEAIMHIIDFEK